MAVGAGARVASPSSTSLTFAPPWLVLLPGLRFWPALMMTQATTALSLVVPGGAAVGIATVLRDVAARGLRDDAPSPGR